MAVSCNMVSLHEKFHRLIITPIIHINRKMHSFILTFPTPGDGSPFGFGRGMTTLTRLPANSRFVNLPKISRQDKKKLNIVNQKMKH